MITPSFFLIETVALKRMYESSEKCRSMFLFFCWLFPSKSPPPSISPNPQSKRIDTQHIFQHININSRVGRISPTKAYPFKGSLENRAASSVIRFGLINYAGLIWGLSLVVQKRKKNKIKVVYTTSHWHAIVLFGVGDGKRKTI